MRDDVYDRSINTKCASPNLLVARACSKDARSISINSFQFMTSSYLALLVVPARSVLIEKCFTLIFLVDVRPKDIERVVLAILFS